jgi:sulfonate transport system substrate-binding protein
MRVGSSRVLLAAIAVSTMVLAAGASAQTPQTIRVGWTVPAEEAKWLIMKRPELFPNHGKVYQIEWSQFQGTPPMSQALMAAAVDCATQAPISFGQAAAEGNFQGYILGSLAQEREDHFSVLWAVKKGSSIKSAADLKGKTVASTAFGGGIYYFMLLWMKQHGIDPEKDIRLTEIGFPLVEDALKAGRADAGPFAQPFASRAFERDSIEKLFAISEVQSPLTDTFEACRKEFVDAHPAAIKAYMDDFKAATRYAFAHPDEAKKVTAEVTKIDFATLDKYLLSDKDFYRDPNGTPDFAAIQKTWDLFFENGYLKKHLTVDDYKRLDLTPNAD